MKISARNEFAASPSVVREMFSDPAWLSDVCERAGVLEHTIEADADRSVVTQVHSTPSAAKAVIGPRLEMVQEITWRESEDPEHHASDLTITVPGKPVTVAGVITLGPGGAGTVADFAGDISVKIPLIGKKLESQAAGVVTDVIKLQQDAGDAWLAARG